MYQLSWKTCGQREDLEDGWMAETLLEAYTKKYFLLVWFIAVVDLLIHLGGAVVQSKAMQYNFSAPYNI